MMAGGGGGGVLEWRRESLGSTLELGKPLILYNI